MMPKPEINSQRLWDTIMETAEFGGTARGGVCRLTLTDSDRQVRDWFVKACKETGCSVAVDEMGNIFALRPGKNRSLPPIAMGSHLDTQPSGGKFDGIVGVLSGLEVLRALHEVDFTTDSPLELIDWTNEEGSRFAPTMIGSGVFAGVINLNFAYAVKDRDGKKFGDELERIGYRGKTKCGNHKLGTYFELHIEQGPVLEAENKMIGVVTGVQGLRWYDVAVVGRDSHAGSTPMHLRKDAMLACARMVEAANKMALNHSPLGVSTVGFIEVKPNSRNVIPGHVSFSVDIRHSEDSELDQMEKELEVLIASIAGDMKLEARLEKVCQFPSVQFDGECVSMIRNSVKELGYGYRNLISGAGHDAVYISRVAPTSMIFIPCEAGISHNELEKTDPEQVAAGANVLMNAVIVRDRAIQSTLT
ncbi:Zn-dependent hydrolase [Chloroflexota bacterium]